MQVNIIIFSSLIFVVFLNFIIDLALRLLFIDLHFFIATIQIIVQVCYTPQARLLSNLFTSCLRHSVE